MLGRTGVMTGLIFFGVGMVVLNYISYNQREINVIEKKTRQYTISLKDGKSRDIHVREAGTGNNHILLLHGRNSSSKFWEDTGTLECLSDWGYRAIAVDIPNDGSVDTRWLRKVIDALQLRNLVIISPSTSGRMTLQYLFQLPKKQKFIRGFVPIDPVDIDQFPVRNYKKLQVPTLIIHGENNAFAKLQQIPRSTSVFIENTFFRSSAEEPIEFHTRLRQFLYQIFSN